MRKIVSIAPALVVLVVAIVTLAAAPTAIRSMQTAQTQARIALAQQRLSENDVLERLSNAVADLAEVVEPSVVHIDAFSRGRRNGGAMSSGSGWVYDASGHIITNAHVIRGADFYTVQFSDGYTVRAEFVGLDTPTDVGVLKVDEDASAIPLVRATGDRLRQGQRVFAFGSPFGFRFSMSEGIVSALGRNAQGVTGTNGYTNFIQTDAAVNPGNSGGPLVDVRGRVVGMNTAIVTAENPTADVTRQGQSAGIGFAIPLDTIESVAGQIIESGIVVKGWLGIRLFEASAIRSDDLPGGFRGSGVYVLRVEGEPARRAGLQPGDVIISVNGERTPDSNVLRAKVGSTRPGTTVTMRVVRAVDDGYQELDLQVEIGAAVVDARQNLVPVPDSDDPAEVLARENADIMRINGALEALSRLGMANLSLRGGGLNLEVRPDSALAEAGLTSKDFVIRANGREVVGYESFTDAIADALEASPPAPISLVVRNAEGEERSITLPLERR